jgi:LAO/AO transport system kinase
MKEKVDSMLDSDNTFAKFLKKVQSKQIDPYEAADKVSKSLVK